MSSVPILEVAVEPVEDGCVIRVRGEVDISTVEALRGPISRARQAGANTLVDLSGVSFMDSSGLHLMLDAALDAETDGWSLAFRPSWQVRRLLEVTGTLEVVRVAPDEPVTDTRPG
jgi:anti-sigma B factor antagonist